jgi:glyoxylase-like metal-dependent hydrolase (beta-lactamase superfamily II)
MHEVVVLVEGYVEASGAQRQRTAGSVTLVRGDPNILVDTGDPWQREELLDALATADLNPADIGFVINTHGHLDHVANNNLFPHATFILGSDVARHGEYWTHAFDRGPLVIEATDGSDPIAVIATPGHTDHDLSVLVRTHDGVVAIVGDLFEYEADETDDAWRRWTVDAAQQQASRDSIRDLADYIVPGHGGIFRVRSDG